LRSCVEPSMSVNKNVTVPTGSSTELTCGRLTRRA
jgi:hypothetical protein